MSAVNRFLFGAESPRRYAIVATGLTVLLGLRVALGPYRRLADVPAAVFRPVWFLSFLDGMPSAATIVALQVVGALAAVAALASPRARRLGFATAWLSLLVLGGLRGSRGKILHNDVLLLLVCVPFLLGPVVRRWNDRRPSLTHGWPVRTALAVTAGTYFFCGLAKVTHSGLAWVSSDNVANVFRIGAISGRPWFPGVAQRLVPAGHVIAGCTLALELSFLVVLVWPRVRPLYAAGAVALHVGTWLVLGIDYWAWVGVALLVLVDWSDLRRRHAVRDPDSIADEDIEAQLAGQVVGLGQEHPPGGRGGEVGEEAAAAHAVGHGRQLGLVPGVGLPGE